jgi:hypothetical protein
VNLLDIGTTWKAVSEADDVFEGRDHATGEPWTGTRVDLVFGSNSQLRAMLRDATLRVAPHMRLVCEVDPKSSRSSADCTASAKGKRMISTLMVQSTSERL